MAKKFGEFAISQVGPQILAYAKNRSMYGKEITVFVKSVSGNVSSRLGDDLYIALKKLKVQKTSIFVPKMANWLK